MFGANYYGSAYLGQSSGIPVYDLGNELVHIFCVIHSLYPTNTMLFLPALSGIINLYKDEAHLRIPTAPVVIKEKDYEA